MGGSRRNGAAQEKGTAGGAKGTGRGGRRRSSSRRRVRGTTRNKCQLRFFTIVSSERVLLSGYPPTFKTVPFTSIFKSSCPAPTPTPSPLWLYPFAPLLPIPMYILVSTMLYIYWYCFLWGFGVLSSYVIKFIVQHEFSVLLIKLRDKI